MNQKIRLGQRVEQVRAEPAFRGNIGRVGTVEEMFEDELGQTHCKTREDRIWCPVHLLKVL